jgi:hypothetical protein
MSAEHLELDRLNEYLDRELDPRDHRRVEAHLSECAECRRAFEALTEIAHRASELPPVSPPDRIWQAIAATIEQKAGKFGDSQPAWRKGLYPALALAATLVLGLSIWAVMRTPEPPQPSDPNALANMVTEELKAAESHYEKAIGGLEQIIAQNGEVLPQETAAVLNRNLDLIENAIRESRTAIATEPQSAAAQQSLLQALRSKVSLLQNTILLINEVRKGEGENALDLIEEMRKPSPASNPI